MRVATIALCLVVGLAVPHIALAAKSLHVVSIDGMTCSSCSDKVREALLGTKGVTSAVASHLAGKACIETEGELDSKALGAALKQVDYELGAHETVAECPEGLRGSLPDPWDQRSEGLDVVVISHGEEVDLKAQRVTGKYTIIDFGASWCEPCHDAAETLVPYLKQHPDVAVRAVHLAGEDPTSSYEQPVVAQHLQWVKGVPWFIVHAPGGKVLHKGMDVAKVMSSIDKHRNKLAKKKR